MSKGAVAEGNQNMPPQHMPLGEWIVLSCRQLALCFLLLCLKPGHKFPRVNVSPSVLAGKRAALETTLSA